MARDVQIKSESTGRNASHASAQKKTSQSRQKAGARAADAKKYGYTPREWDRYKAAERRERKALYRLIAVMVLLIAIAAILVYFVYDAVFRSHDVRLEFPYDISSSYAGLLTDTGDSTAQSFAEDLCVTDTNVNTDKIELDALGAGLFDLTSQNVAYAKDIFITRSPASLTKIMTALVALKYGNLDDTVTVTETVKDIEYGSSVCDIKEGDRLTLRQLLYGMMIASGNDAAMMIAEYIGGSVDDFVSLMNEEALQIGATRTHFANPHGLTDTDHYTCVYDLYLIFNEAMKNDTFVDIISRSNYYAEYTDETGAAVAVTWESTNHYFTGEAALPENVRVYGGKTGTTEDAGACLALLTKDSYGNPYIAVIMHSSDKEILYEDMNKLLSLVSS